MQLVNSAFFVEAGTNQVLSYLPLLGRLRVAQVPSHIIEVVEASARNYACGLLLAEGQVTVSSPLTILDADLARAGLCMVTGMFPAYPADPLLASGDLSTPMLLRLAGGLEAGKNQPVMANSGSRTTFPSFQHLNVEVGPTAHSSSDVLCMRVRNVAFGEEDIQIPTPWPILVLTPPPANSWGTPPPPPQEAPSASWTPPPTPPLQEAPSTPWVHPSIRKAQAEPSKPSPSAEAQHEKSMSTIKSMFSMF